MKKNLFRLLILFLLFITSIKYGQSQVQHWDYKQREKSQSLHSQAMTSLNKGQFKQAENLLITANTVDGSNPLPYSTLGFLLAIRGEFEQAIASLNKSYELGRENETLLSLGFAYYLKHDYDNAINSWDKILANNPRLTNVLVNLGYGYLRKGDFAKANEYFEQSIRSYPSSQITYQALAELNYLSGNFKQAEKSCMRSDVIFPYAPVALINAKSSYMQGNLSRCRKSINEYLKLVSKKAKKRSMTALGYLPQHDFYFDPYLLDKYDNAYLLQARMLDMKKYASRARYYARKGKAQNKETLVKQALEKSANDFYLSHELGLIQLANAEFTDASDSFKKVITLCPDCKVDLLNLAKSLYFDGKKEEAAHYIRQFQKDKPNEELLPLFKNIGLTDPKLSPELSPVDNSGNNGAGF
jgi:tetratricopeptide (TPR) repeat protein